MTPEWRDELRFFREQGAGRVEHRIVDAIRCAGEPALSQQQLTVLKHLSGALKTIADEFLLRLAHTATLSRETVWKKGVTLVSGESSLARV